MSLLLSAALLGGCVSGTQRALGQARVGLAYSNSCFQLLGIDPAYEMVRVHLRRTGPATPGERVGDDAAPTEADAATIVAYRARQRDCQAQEQRVLHGLAPSLADAQVVATASEEPIYQALTERRISWADGRKQLWYVRDVARIQQAPILAEVNEGLRQRLIADRQTGSIVQSALVGAAAGAGAAASYRSVGRR